MSWFSRARNALRGDSLSREIDAEMAFHISEKTEQLVQNGMTRREAEHEARRRFGNVGHHMDETRDRDVAVWLDTLASDVRYALRTLRGAPAFTIVAALSLALGIGPNTAIFSVINAVMIKTLPLRNADELLALTSNVATGQRGKPGGGSFDNRTWEMLRDRQDVFDGFFAYASTHIDVGTGGDSRQMPVGFVSGEFFKTLGAGASQGRVLTPGDDVAGCAPVAVVTHSFWRTALGETSDASSQRVMLDGKPFQIVGVTDRAFFGIEFGYHVPVWVPLCAEGILRGSGGGQYAGGMSRFIVGRPKAGTTLEQIRARLATLAPPILAITQPAAVAELEDNGFAPVINVQSFSKGIPALSMSYGETLLTMLAVVGIVLLIACANVANLLLARSGARQREIASRIALGATRGRLVRQLLTESLLLGLIGGALGVIFALGASKMLAGFMAAPRQSIELDVMPDVTVLGFTVLVSIVTAFVFGLAPAISAARVDVHVAMRAGMRGATRRRTRFNAGKLLVGAQIALCLVSLTGAALLIGSWRRLATLDPGFRREGVLLVEASMRGAPIPESQRSATYRRIVERVRRVPGVLEAGVVARTPIGRMNWATNIEVPGYTPAREGDAFVQLNEASDRYFATIGTPLLAGRDFAATDIPAAPRVAIVSEELARRFFGGTANAVGRHISVNFFGTYNTLVEVIGVVGNTKLKSLREPDPPIVYFAQTQNVDAMPFTTFVARTSGDPAAAARSIRAAISEIEPRIPLSLSTLAQQLDDSLRAPRVIALLFGFFGALALLLATVGLYGIMAYSVTRRRREIGVRLALGAARGRVVRMVMSDAALIVAGGVVAGVPLAIAASRLVTSFLYGVEPGDPVSLAGSAVVLGVVGVVAALIPARRAACLDPVTTLRED